MTAAPPWPQCLMRQRQAQHSDTFIQQVPSCWPFGTCMSPNCVPIDRDNGSKRTLAGRALQQSSRKPVTTSHAGIPVRHAALDLAHLLLWPRIGSRNAGRASPSAAHHIKQAAHRVLGITVTSYSQSSQQQFLYFTRPITSAGPDRLPGMMKADKLKGRRGCNQRLIYGDKPGIIWLSVLLRGSGAASG